MTDAFLDDPGAWARPERAAAWFAPGLSAATAAALLASPRLAARSSAYLAERLGRGRIEALDPLDATLARVPATTLGEVGRAAGAIRHAPRLRAMVLASDIAVVEARIGPASRAIAMRHGGPGPRPVATDDLAADVLGDGAACLAAWIASLPAWAANRVRLKLEDDDTPPAEPPPALGARIAAVRAAAHAMLR